jgi:hypothetical protein
MSAQIGFNPYISTNATGSFNKESTGYVQGTALDQPSVRNALSGGTLAADETLPMWGGVGIYEVVPGAANTPDGVLGGQVGRATNLTLGAAKSLTGFSVFDQDHAMVNSPQSPVPLSATYGQVNFYRLGSGARIAVKAADSLVALDGSIITSQVSWDYVDQMLVPYSPAFNAVTITGATWSATNGGEYAFTVGTDLSAVLTDGDEIDVAGILSTFALNPNGAWVVVGTPSSTVVTVAAPAAANAGAYTSGGTIAAGGGPLAVRVLEVAPGNSMTVDYDPTTGFATWDRTGTVAIILI